MQNNNQEDFSRVVMGLQVKGKIGAIDLGK